MFPLEAPLSAFGKKHAEPRPMGACSRRLFPVVKISGFLGEQADATQNLFRYIIDTDAPMIGRAGLTAKRKGREIALFTKQPSRGGALPPCSQPRRLGRFTLAQFLHLDFCRLAAFHPPQHVNDAGGVLGAPAMLADGDEIASLKRGDQFARLFSVAVSFQRHALDGFGERCHGWKAGCWVGSDFDTASSQSRMCSNGGATASDDVAFIIFDGFIVFRSRSDRCAR